MAKKQSKMTPEEQSIYLSECDDILLILTDVITSLTKFLTTDVSAQEAYEVRKNLLNKEFNNVLRVLQCPKESSDYSEPHLRMWRAEVRRLDDIANRYLKTLYTK